MPPVLIPKRLEQVWPVLDEPGVVVYAGGTDTLVKEGAGTKKSVNTWVCLERIPELQGLEDQEDRVRIGAGTTHARLLASPVIQRHFPVLAQALGVLGSPPIRNMGTIGGNICSASPAGDTLPPLYVLGAEVELRSRSAGRRLPISEFIAGPGQTARQPGELVTGIRIPKAPRFNCHHYEKVGQRRALAIAIVSLAALIELTPGGLINDIRLAWGSVGPTVVAAPTVEARLRGRPLALEVLQEAAADVHRAIAPIDDIRASADYRRTVAGNLLGRLSLLRETGSEPTPQR